NLRLWWVMNHCRDLVDACDKVSELLQRVAVLEAENEAQKAQLNDGWTNRVTFDNMVEQIAACEDASERDEARKMVETMLKRDVARKFREAIRNRVQEQNVQEGAKIQIKRADVQVMSPGNNIAHTIVTNQGRMDDHGER
ncbi:MAG: hypothetical protein J5545_12555, partial [Bacteroidaceae bacterium]|nr:hypothetical protein [Bacteroidaceae bacterium]